MWSNDLIKKSRELLNINGVSVKSLNGEFGILIIEKNPPVYTVCFYDEDQAVVFNSVDELINAGWAVD